MTSKRRILSGPLTALAAVALALALLTAPPLDARPEPDAPPTKVTDELRTQVAAPSGALAIITTWDRDGLADVARLGIEGRRFDTLPMVVAPALTAAQLAALEDSPAVRSVWHEERFELHMQESTHLVGAREAWTGVLDAPGVTGEGFELAVIDTGAFGMHADFENLIEFCETSAELIAVICTGDTLSADDNGHGTHVAGTMVGTGAASGGMEDPHSTIGVAPKAKVRSYSSNLGAFLLTSEILAAYDDITTKKLAGDNDVIAINNSFGGGTGDDYDPDEPQQIAFQTAHAAGILPVFSAGNSGPGHNTLGRQCLNPYVACVGANTKPDSMAGFSSVGRPAAVADTNADGVVGGDGDVAPDNHDRAIARELGVGLYRPALTAPGVDINAMSSTALTCTVGNPNPTGCYEELSGTSMSAPHVTGATALIAEAFTDAHGRHPTPDEMIDILERSSVTLPGYAAEQQGAGRLDVPRAVTMARSYPQGPALSLGTPTPTFASGAHPGSPGALTDTQVGCTQPLSWEEDGWGQHAITVPERSERVEVTIDWPAHQTANLYLRLWRPGVDPDGRDAEPGPDRVYPDGEDAGLVYLGVDEEDTGEFDGTSRTVSIPMPEDGEWILRVYHRAGGAPAPCPGDSDEDPKRDGGFTYEVTVSTPRYVDPPTVTVRQAEDSGDVRRIAGSASYPAPLEGITTWEVPGTAVGEDEPTPTDLRVTDLRDRLRVAWDAVETADAYEIHRLSSPDAPTSASTLVDTTAGVPCSAPNVPSWPTASRPGLCFTDTGVTVNAPVYYRVVALDGGTPIGTSLLGYGTAAELDRLVRLRVDRIFGRGYWEHADTTRDARSWSHLWDAAGVPDPATPLARSFSQGVGSATIEAVPTDAVIRRLFGSGRIQTAVDVSRNHIAEGSGGTVVLARADLYPDALAGAPLAYQLDAPILLTPSDALHGDTAAELQRIGAEQVVLLGGRAALSDQVADDVAALDIAVDRVDGRNRFDTAALIASRLDRTGPGAIIAEGGHPDPGRGWPDPLSAAPLAAHTARPILLVTSGTLPGETASALADLGITETLVVGGSGAVGTDVEEELAQRGHGPQRVFGSTRYATSRAVFDASVAAGLDPDRIWIATGRDFPDALAAGPMVAAQGGTLILADGHSLDGSPPARALLTERSASITEITLLGGTAAISDTVEAEIRALLQ